jgi:hypothetical protein
MIPAQAQTTKAMISPVSRTAGHTQVGYIDTLGADYVKIDANVSDIATTGTASATGGTLSLGEADDTNVSNATTIVADRTGAEVRAQRHLPGGYAHEEALPAPDVHRGHRRRLQRDAVGVRRRRRQPAGAGPTGPAAW